VDRRFDADGVTCSVCHSIQQVDTRGTGSYVLGQPAVMVDEAGKPIYGEVPDKEILAHLDRHSKAVMKDFYRPASSAPAMPQGGASKDLERLQVAAPPSSSTTNGS